MGLGTSLAITHPAAKEDSRQERGIFVEGKLHFFYFIKEKVEIKKRGMFRMPYTEHLRRLSFSISISSLIFSLVWKWQCADKIQREIDVRGLMAPER
jgi:hypothetical protein